MTEMKRISDQEVTKACCGDELAIPAILPAVTVRRRGRIAQAQLEADQKVLEETKIEIFLEFRNLLLEHCPEAAVSDWLADFSAKHFQIPKLLRSVDGETPAASSQTYTTSKKIIKETGQTKSKWRVNEWHVVEG